MLKNTDLYSLLRAILLFMTIPGYYLYQMFYFKLGFAMDSRGFTIPYRIFMVIIFAYYIAHNSKALFKNNNYIFLLLWFWIIYLLRMIYDVYFLNLPLSMGKNDYILYSLSFGMIPALYFSLPDTLESSRKSEQLIMYGCAFLSIFSFLFYRDFFVESAGRLKGLDDNNLLEATIGPLAISYVSSIPFCFGLYQLAFYSKAFYKSLFFLIAPIPGLLMGASRGSIFAILFTILLIAIIKKRKNLIKISLAIIILTSSIPLIYSLSEDFGSSLFVRIIDTFTGESFSHERERPAVWLNAWNNFLDSPLIGDYIENRGIGSYPHNILLEAFMASGIIGGLPFFLLLILSFRQIKLLCRYNTTYDWLLITFSISFVSNMFSGGIWTASWFWSCLGFLFSQKYLRQKNYE